MPHSSARRERGAGGGGRMRALLAYMRSNAPGMHIVVLGILPRGAWSLPSQFAWPNRLTRTLAAINAASEVRSPGTARGHPARARGGREPRSAQQGSGVQGAAGGGALCPVAEGAWACSRACSALRAGRSGGGSRGSWPPAAATPLGPHSLACMQPPTLPYPTLDQGRGAVRAQALSASDGHIHYMDCSAGLTNATNVEASLLPDALHPNPAGAAKGSVSCRG